MWTRQGHTSWWENIPLGFRSLDLKLSRPDDPAVDFVPVVRGDATSALFSVHTRTAWAIKDQTTSDFACARAARFGVPRQRGWNAREIAEWAGCQLVEGLNREEVEEFDSILSSFNFQFYSFNRYLLSRINDMLMISSSLNRAKI